MSLVSIVRILQEAQQGGYAVPLFDTADLQSTEGMFAALEEKKAPTIVGLWSGMLGRPNARAFVGYLRARAEDATVPVALMLDHGTTLGQCLEAIALGFTDVMYDGSQLALPENIARTRAVARAAHAAGVGVEAELGHVGLGSEYPEFGARRQGFTDPGTVAGFAEDTGVDALAIAIGTAHGLYKGTPQLDLGLLREIRSRVDIPLVLHGGTGLAEEQFRAAIAAGISKINIATDLFVAASRRVVEAARGEQASYFDLTKAATGAFRERCAYFMDLFGAAGQG